MPERTYVSQINECITEALKNGYAVRQPESGLHYIVMKTDGASPGQVMGSLDLKAPWVFSLNQAKMERVWAPYLPFTLTIEDKDHLWDFIQGNIFILVLVESDALCQIAINKGYQAKFDRVDELYLLRVELPENGGMVGISEHLLTRIGMEFVSPEWVVLSSIESFEAVTRGITITTAR